MINYVNEELFNQDSVKKNWSITYNQTTLTESDLRSEIVLTERLCSDSQLKFGSCEASELRFTVGGSTNIQVGDILTVSLVLNDDTLNPFQLGIYKVFSNQQTADHSQREIIAYDAMTDILEADVTEWYNGLTFPMSLLDFRNSFFTYLNITQDNTSLINDTAILEETIAPSQLLGSDVITAICEINGCFGHINRENVFKYIALERSGIGLYPAVDLYPDTELYPRESGSSTVEITRSDYRQALYEYYECLAIDKVQVRQSENDIGAVSGVGDNCYIVQDNFLVYGMDAADLQTIADNILSVIENATYTPADVIGRGNPCIELGDILRVTTSENVFNTYVLQREFSGIITLVDEYISEGPEELGEQNDFFNRQIIQLRGKTNELTRTVEETRSEITDVAAGLSSRITQNATAISSEVTRATGAENSLSSQIQQTATEISAKVSETGGSASTFGWTLKSTGFELKSTNKTVFKCNASGIEVDGKVTATSGYIGSSSTGFIIESSNIRNGKARLSDDATSGVYIGTDGINIGSYGFKVTSAGVTTIGAASHQSDLNLYGDIVFKDDGYIMRGTQNSIKLEINKITIDSLARLVTSLLEVKDVYVNSSSGSNIFLSSKDIEVYSGTTASSTYRQLLFNSTQFEVYSANVRIGTATGKVGFFGASAHAKTTVANKTYTSSTTASSVGADLNELKTALRNYGLIG